MKAHVLALVQHSCTELRLRCCQYLADSGCDCAGIAASNDKMLQSRLVAYADAQRYRLGINYLQLPINQPWNHYHNNHNEGNIQVMDKTEEVSRIFCLPCTVSACA